MKKTIISLILCLLCAFYLMTFTACQKMPDYVQSKSLLITIETNDKPMATDTALAHKLYATIEEIIRSPYFINEANNRYHAEFDENDNIVISNIVITTEESTVTENAIIKITYYDNDEETAANKLTVYTNVVKDLLETRIHVTTDNNIKVEIID